MSDTAVTTAPSVRFGFMKFVVADVDAMVGFYERAFGLSVVQTIKGDGFVEKIMRRADAEAGFSLILFHYEDGREITLGAGYGPIGFYLRDVDAAYAHAVSQGATAHRPPYVAGNMRVAFVLDPEGREIELISIRRG